MSGLGRRRFLQAVGGMAAAYMGSQWAQAATSQPVSTLPAERLNILLITADDMNYDSLGVTGCKVESITPNLDRLAREGILFRSSHVTVAVCQPSRECLMTGRYPHRNGAVGFYPIRRDVPTLQESLKAAGYTNGILAKVEHLAPRDKFCWDYVQVTGDLGMGREPELYYKHTRDFIANAKKSGRPFFLMANSCDPHRPWAGSAAEKSAAARLKEVEPGEENRGSASYFPPARRYYKPEEVTIPGFLPDLPQVRQEMAEYYSSTHRCNETVGQVLRVLKELDCEHNTLVMFLSDNGISMPFAKSNCYLFSTRTPWIVRWPGKVKPGTLDDAHMVAGIDYMPTILEAAGLSQVPGMDGRSFLPLLLGREQPGWDHVFTQFDETNNRKSFPMRCVQNRRFGYIYNAWSDGKVIYHNEGMDGPGYKGMKQAATTQKAVADRVAMLEHRVPEELYDLQADPDALHNLIEDPRHKDQVRQMRADLLAWMQKTGDPCLDAYRKCIGKGGLP